MQPGPAGIGAGGAKRVGTHTIQVWHEEYGTLSQTVTVEAGGVAVADFTYPPAS